MQIVEESENIAEWIRTRIDGLSIPNDARCRASKANNLVPSAACYIPLMPNPQRNHIPAGTYFLSSIYLSENPACLWSILMNYEQCSYNKAKALVKKGVYPIDLDAFNKQSFDAGERK